MITEPGLPNETRVSRLFESLRVRVVHFGDLRGHHNPVRLADHVRRLVPPEKICKVMTKSQHHVAIPNDKNGE
jgi:hypothetical protein